MLFIVFTVFIFIFFNAELVRTDDDNYNTRTTPKTNFPDDISQLTRAQIAQLRLLHDQLERNEATEERTGPVPESLAELSSIRSRRNRPLPKCSHGGERAKAFIMVFMGHSGSTAIITELMNHSQVHVAEKEPLDHQSSFNTTEALQIARGIFDNGVQLDKTVGFKMRPQHILAQPEAWRQLVAEYDARIIWQYRKNLFKAAIGEYTNRYLNDTSVVEGLEKNLSREERCRIGAGCSFRIENFHFLHENLRSMIRSQRLITQAVATLSTDSLHAGTPCVREMPYEDYLYDRDAFMSDLKRFLGLGRESTAPARFKATSDNMCEVVENWDELCDKFYGCVLWQHMLDDPRNECYCTMASGVPSSANCDIF